MISNNIREELKSNMIEYGYGVNTDRAIPDSKTGLKPVARRILWDMYRNGFTDKKPHVKCAKIVGSVMGSLHPHSDSSIYEALVRLSKPWIMRYPLIDFHGNQGNISGDGPASMRYTESRLSSISDWMMYNIKKENVDTILNYDDSEKEPYTLPSVFPNLLCNPNTGIGYGLACSWLPHNLNEVAKAVYNYLDGNEPTLEGPDFPTGGLIINKDDIPKIMQTGRGSIKLRGKYKLEEKDNKIVFYEIPYGISTESLLEKISSLCEKEEIKGIEEIRDESNKKGLRLVIIYDKKSNPNDIVKKLFLKTDLQLSISYNQVALIDKTPTELNLKDCIEIYVNHNIDCLIRETKYDIKKAEERKEIVEGLLKALANINDIITLIKGSESSTAARESLIRKYKFTENQTKAILAMRLSSLARLEGVELEQELAGLLSNLSKWKELINSKEKQNSVIRERLQSLVKIFGDARRTELAQIEVSKEEENEEIVPEDIVVMFSQSSNIKRISKSAFNIQHRRGKGIKNKDDIQVITTASNTTDNLYLFTLKGKAYKVQANNVPEATNASKGLNVSNFIKIESDDKVIAMTSLPHGSNAKYVVFFTKNGLVKKTSLEEYKNITKGKGIAAISLKENDSIANIVFCNDEDMVVVTKNGMAIKFESKFISPIGRVTKGVKSIALKENDEVLIGLPIYNKDDLLAMFTKSGYGKKIQLNELPIQARGGRGLTISDDLLVSASIINNDDNLLITGKTNIIYIKSEEVPLLSRTSIGNIINDGEIVSVIKL